MHKRLDFAYKASSEEARRQTERYKAYYDLKVHENKLVVGDRVLVEKLGIKGKHKIADKWEEEPYIVLDQPIPDIPEFKVKREDGHGRLRTLHRNQLLPFTGLPAPIIDEESDDVREEEAEEAPDSDSHLFQYHDTSSEADEEPEDTSSQVNQYPRQRRSGESSQLPPRRQPVRQHKPPKWMATDDWVL